MKYKQFAYVPADNTAIPLSICFVNTQNVSTIAMPAYPVCPGNSPGAVVATVCYYYYNDYFHFVQFAYFSKLTFKLNQTTKNIAIMDISSSSNFY